MKEYIDVLQLETISDLNYFLLSSAASARRARVTSKKEIPRDLIFSCLSRTL